LAPGAGLVIYYAGRPPDRPESPLIGMIATLAGTTFLGFVVAGWRGLVAGYVLGCVLAAWLGRGSR
jgi:hypothetical protein